MVVRVHGKVTLRFSSWRRLGLHAWFMPLGLWIVA